jgi:aryl-phospho-beta-D-glucosidase BglC (GH1 family)
MFASINVSRRARGVRRAFALFAALCLLAPLAPRAAAAPAQSRFVTTRGKQLVAPDGSILRLKGINLGNWLLPEGYMFRFEHASSPRLIQTVFAELRGEEATRKFWNEFRDRYITRDDIRFVKRAGFNCVRVPFSYRLLVTDDEPRRFEGDGWKRLDDVVAWCRDEGIWVILDMHAAPGGQTGDNIDDSWGYPFLYESKESRELPIELWRRIAERYRDEQIVLGYDLLTEPIAHYFDVEHLNPFLEPLYREIVAAVRTVDKNHTVILGGAQWDSNFKVFGKPFDSTEIYTFHKYWTEPTEEVVKEYVDYSEKYDVPLLMGESGENTDEWITSFRTMLDRKEIGWTFWPYKKMTDKGSCVVTVPEPKDWAKIRAYANLPRTSYEDVRKARLDPKMVEAAFAELLENVRLERCEVNRGYLTALGLDSKVTVAK